MFADDVEDGKDDDQIQHGAKSTGDEYEPVVLVGEQFEAGRATGGVEQFGKLGSVEGAEGGVTGGDVAAQESGGQGDPD